MAYSPRLPRSLERTHAPPDGIVGSPILRKPVTTVTAVTEILDLTLSEFAAARCAVEVHVPWLSYRLWWVSGTEQVARLLERGVHRGRILTASELAEVYKLPSDRPHDAVKLISMKVEFDAELLTVDMLENTDAARAIGKGGAQ